MHKPFNNFEIYTKITNKLKGIRERKGRNPHYNLTYISPEGELVKIRIPRGRDTSPNGTYYSMAKGLRLSVKQFNNLIKCDLSKKEYDKILKQNPY